MENNRVIGIYVHIPFCVKKCKYCDFLSFNCDEGIHKEYIEALKKEIWLYSLDANYLSLNINNEYSISDMHENENNRKYSVSSIYIGGGTPSIIKGEYIYEIIECIRKFYNVASDVEITIEVNPGTITEEKVKLYKSAGINRVSIGLQSANDEELKVLGRIHTYDEFLKTYNMFRDNGFDNVSVDVMSAIPNQTVESYKETLNKIIALRPEHISSYSLILEEGTYFFDMQDELELANEDDERDMYYITKEVLKENGYNRYEISNYSLEGKESFHNSNYWDVTKHYLGVGLGASSYMLDKKNKFRFDKIDDINKYISLFKDIELSGKYNASQITVIKENLECNRELVTLEHELEDYMYLGLRMVKGISITKFNEMSYIGKTIFDFYGAVIDKYKDLGLLVVDGDRIYLTEKGIDVSNTIFADFIDKVDFYE